ncbi:toll/interleukin-1 receptor domain-containing protein [Lentzea kentuckyensis]|uniref:toll/interleukin-1 receptor domain-containing protein n=1 Tax=Lentzea kentuckyensis TaxID=360086 RepID=UPI00117BC1B6|nr:toll/interleukin-1 receptor domain-containing protein [Lentzea kentuckyensis]
MLFISFRVGDGEDKAAWLDAELNTIFGKNGVFRSSRSISLGHDYEPIMWGAVENCSAMIVVIGDKWLTEFGPRLFEPDDVVRREVATALSAGKPVIPVLGHGGRMHRAHELPEDLAELANHQYIRLTYRDPHMLPGLVDRLIDSVPELAIGVREGIKDLATWTRERSVFAGPEMPPDLVLHGRETASEQLQSWLAGPPGNLVVQGQTVDEVAAFAAAVLERHDPHHRAMLLSSEAGWGHALRIPPSFPAVVVSDSVPVRQTQNTRHVIIARDGFEGRAEGLVLPRVPREQARDAFLAQGLPLHRADEYAGLVRRSLRAVTRRLHPNEPRPAWTQAPASAIAAPLVLVSRWSATSEADHAAIARIAGHDYAEVDRFVTSSAASGDPLVHRSGSRWQLADPYDGWSQLMSLVSATDMSRFCDTAIEVLSEVDPVLSLPDPEVMSAGIKGIARNWSSDLREGLAHGLARLGDAGTAKVAGDEAQNHAARVVVQLLRKANDDRTGLLWRSLNDVLPLLAEACPQVFVEAVDRALRGDSPVLRAVFEDAGERTLFRHSAHTGLLWALETLTWSPEHSTRAVLLMARLAEVDPGGRLSNRPAQSLVDALTHRPVSPIPLDRRPALINQVRARHAAVGWQLLMDLTEPNHFLMYPARPKVRIDWIGGEQTSSEMVEAYRDDVFSAAMADLLAAPRRWAEFLPRITWLPPVCRDRLLTALEAVDTEALGVDGARELWKEGNELVRHELATEDGPRHLSPGHTDRLSSFLDRIESEADSTRHAWLFGWHPDLPGIDPTDHERHRTAVEELRREVVTEELARHGIDGLARLAAVSQRGDLVGWTLAQVEGDAVRDEVFAVLGDPFTSGWIRCRARDGGHDWVAEAAAAVPADPAARTAFLLALPVESAMEQIAAEGAETRDRFWLSTPAFPFPEERAEEYLAEILGRDRPEAVIDALALALHENSGAWRPSTDLIEAAFDSLLKLPRRVNSRIDYEVGKLLTYLHVGGHDLPAVAKWEISFSGLFHDRRPSALLELIAADPRAFVELHQFRYLPTGKLNPRAMAFFMTGEGLRCVPGQTGDLIDGERLLGWVRQAREALAEADLLSSGDRSIGSLISAGPKGEDGAWPAEAVRDILELEDAYDLRDGFGIGLANNNGFSTRSLYEGGRREREEAAQYAAWADQVESSWPYTAQVLRDHAGSLLAQGRYWDKRAEDDQDE